MLALNALALRVFRHTNLILLPALLSSDEELVLQAEVGIKMEEKVRKQLTECFEKISTDVRKWLSCEKLVKASLLVDNKT
jgi:hypothetical protein